MKSLIRDATINYMVFENQFCKISKFLSYIKAKLYMEKDLDV